MQTEIIDKNLRGELEDNFRYPPGGDPSLKCFYGAVLEMCDAREPLANILTTVQQKRPDRPPKLIVNLLFRAVQSIKLDQSDLAYRDFREAAQWKEELTKITTDPLLSTRLSEILHNRSTNTTIYQRYAGPYAIIAHFYNGSGVSVADLGCGGNYGLRGIELREPFQSVTDHTPGRYVSSLLNQPINLVEGYAIDKEADTEENSAWRLACSVYPQELDQLPSVREYEERIKGSRRIMFTQNDLLICEYLPKNAYNVVILSTILYQLQHLEQSALLERARRMLMENGTLIVQDFAAKNPEDPRQLDFGVSWFAEAFAYRTFVAEKNDKPFREAFRWNNGRCRIVEPGEDFTDVFKLNQTSSASAALAHSTS